MVNPAILPAHAASKTRKTKVEAGFTLAEFLIATLILFVVASGIFATLTEMQCATGFQTEMQSVLNNTQVAMQTAERYIRQAGNDPFGCGLTGITIVSPTEVRIQSDLTGSAGPGNPDKGDPDGDFDDTGENITIRFNNRSRSIEIIPKGGPAQILAGSIYDLSFQYYDANDDPTNGSREVRKIVITLSGSSLSSNPLTRQVFGVKLRSEVRIMT
jgi:type II secretory pathway pseudopilin PulG